METIGQKPIRIGWSETSKGDNKRPKYRSRLVAKEITAVNRACKESLFAATPPSECPRMLLGQAIGEETSRRRSVDDGDPVEVMFLDVKRVHFYAKAIRLVFIEIPVEDSRSSGEDQIAELQFFTYGAQDTAANMGE